MSAAAPTRGQILGLYRKYLATAQSFSSYNFRTYFLRRSRDLFRSSLLPPSQAATASPYSKAGGATVPASPSTLSSPASGVLAASSASTSPADSDSDSPSPSPSDREKLRSFYDAALRDLEVLRRAALMNRIYEGDKLVVERPRIIVGGGGAGAEASVGGAGQPTQGPQGSGGAPPSGRGPM